MKNKNNHPDRIEMIKAAKAGRIPFRAHLKNCFSCQELYDLLRVFHLSISEDEKNISEDLIAKFSSIPLLVESRNPSKEINGMVVFDSWTNLTPQQFRDSGKGYERHIRLKALDIILEIVAEHQLEGWDFTARVYKKNQASSEFILKVGREKLFTLSQKCFYWSAKNPPNKVQLLSPEMKIDFESISWKVSDIK
ncbi:MAG: hypothetical protein KAR07_13155 [Spirochaetes bacterium]|nr:hypothetical protein [Spirochaetota bacterium]